MTTSTVAANTMASKLDVTRLSRGLMSQKWQMPQGPQEEKANIQMVKTSHTGTLASQNMVASPWQSLGLRWRHSAGAHRWPRSGPRLCD